MHRDLCIVEKVIRLSADGKLEKIHFNRRIMNIAKDAGARQIKNDAHDFLTPHVPHLTFWDDNRPCFNHFISIQHLYL